MSHLLAVETFAAKRERSQSLIASASTNLEAEIKNIENKKKRFRSKSESATAEQVSPAFVSIDYWPSCVLFKEWLLYINIIIIIIIVMVIFIIIIIIIIIIVIKILSSSKDAFPSIKTLISFQ